MRKTETCELTVSCLLKDGDRYLLQDRIKKDWQGFTFPGGHIEPGESIVDAVVREMKEETGLTVHDPKLCGVKQFPIDHNDYSSGRYIVFLFAATKYSGELVSSDEGKMYWVSKDELGTVNLVSDFFDLLPVIEDENLSEFQYLVDGNNWNIVIK